MNFLRPVTCTVCLSVGLTAALSANDTYQVEHIAFDSNGSTLAGHLYLPAGVSATATAPTVIVTGAWTSIKEQMAGRYAREMAERGIIALAFDFRTWGQSEGATRSLEDPVMKIADIRAAAEFMTTRPEIASIHGLGICASAGYMATAATGETPMQSVSLVAPWLHDRDLVLAVYGGEAGVAALVETGRAAAAQEQASGEPQLIPAAGPVGSDALMPIGGYYFDPKRGLVKEWENTFNLASWEKWLTFNGIAPGKDITQPTMIVHSEAAAIPDGAKKFFATVPGKKEQHWLDDVGQFEFYDNDTAVDQSADFVAQHIATVVAEENQEQLQATLASPAAEAAAVTVAVAQVGVLADAGSFDQLQSVFADTVAVNYQSLSGQPLEVLSNATLMARWAGLLPGFDQTLHDVTAIEVQLTGGRATATAKVVASHWLGEAMWQVSGQYGYRLVRHEEGWRITSMTFMLTDEQGSRELIGQALQVAATR